MRRRPLFAVVFNMSFTLDGFGLSDREGPILSSLQNACVRHRVKDLPAQRSAPERRAAAATYGAFVTALRQVHDGRTAGSHRPTPSRNADGP